MHKYLGREDAEASLLECLIVEVPYHCEGMVGGKKRLCLAEEEWRRTKKMGVGNNATKQPKKWWQCNAPVWHCTAAFKKSKKVGQHAVF